jgi:starch-binding outer membrane protein, SusD/RagB family
MKKIFFFLITVVALLQTTGCKKNFTDLKPVSEITSANYFQTARQADAALTGAYDALQPDSYYGYDMNTFGEATSDNSLAGGDDPGIFQIDGFTTNPTNNITNRNWPQIYQAIGRTNDVVDNVNKMDVALFFNKPQRKTEIIGEAKFLRALHYFNLVRIYGPVPLVLKQTTAVTADNVNVGNSTIDEIYTKGIIPDLEFAIANLPKDMDKGRATKGAAYGLLAKVYLTRKDWAKAAENVQKVKDLNKYIIISNYDNLFSSKNTEESLFEVQYIGGGEGNPLPDLYLPYPQATFEFLKFHTPTPDIIAAYTPNDVRKKSSIIFQNQFYGANFPHIYKFRNAASFAAPTNFPVLRYADVVLMGAEALNEISYPSQPALEALNAIRQRAGLSPLTFAALSTQNLFRDTVAKERRLELAFEGHRWFDLVRTDKALSTLQAAYPNMSAKNLLFPIPQVELDRNPNLIQNAGY